MQRLLAACLALLAMALSPPAWSAPTEHTFLVPTTSSLAELCADKAATDPMMTAAQNFCEGYLVGAYQVLAQVNAGLGKEAFCIPTPAPTRAQAIAEFLQWVDANPNEGTRPPVDGLYEFLTQRFPCPARQ